MEVEKQIQFTLFVVIALLSFLFWAPSLTGQTNMTTKPNKGSTIWKVKVYNDNINVQR